MSQFTDMSVDTALKVAAANGYTCSPLISTVAGDIFVMLANLFEAGSLRPDHVLVIIAIFLIIILFYKVITSGADAGDDDAPAPVHSKRHSVTDKHGNVLS